jgi:DnaJ-class molecular chaperone
MPQDKTCPTCGGKKVVSCVACEAMRNSDAKNYSWNPLKDVSTWALCACCEGRGEITCPRCEGTGSV